MTPEVDAAKRIAGALSKYHDAKRWYTDEFWLQVANKVVGHRGFLMSVFRDLDANPHAIPNDRIQLRQQRVNDTDSLEFFIEEAAYHKNAYEAAVDMVDRITASRLPEHDPDAVAQDREDDRAREQRQDEHAQREAVRP